jgi:Ca2+-binding EF-hand superfamily protein
MYDPTGTGFANPHAIASMLSKLNIGDISNDDLNMLVHFADMDGDGAIGVDDFRHMVSRKTEYVNEEMQSLSAVFIVPTVSIC